MIVIICIHIYLLPLIISREHFNSEEIRLTIVVYISQIAAHGWVGLVFEYICNFIGEGSIFIIDVEQIIGKVIIGHIDIWIVIIVKIMDKRGVAISTPNNSCLLWNICKYRMSHTAVKFISEKKISGGCIPVWNFGNELIGVLLIYKIYSNK